MARSAGRGLFAYFASHGTAANLLMVLLTVVGLFALPQMRTQYFPDVVLNAITVSVEWEGAGAEDIDAAVVELLEPALMAVDGVAETRSMSVEGQANIYIEFEPGVDIGEAACRSTAR